MQTVLLVIHLFVALALVGVILLQRSEGGALGIGGGNGGAGSIFSARGVGNALTRATAFLAIAFFFTSIALTVLATRGGVGGGSAFEKVAPAAQQNGNAPAAPATGGDAPALPNLGGQPQQPAVPTGQ
ncbi:MAG: preprotein translocase subunit SecG [Rhizobiales bacterium]|nr:preprotein translocase subunit SecG [Hyphomicrobiales bacterium]